MEVTRECDDGEKNRDNLYTTPSIKLDWLLYGFSFEYLIQSIQIRLNGHNMFGKPDK